MGEISYCKPTCFSISSRSEIYNPDFLPAVSSPHALPWTSLLPESQDTRDGCSALPFPPCPSQPPLSKAEQSLHNWCPARDRSPHSCPVNVPGSWFPLPCLLFASGLRVSLSHGEESELCREGGGRGMSVPDPCQAGMEGESGADKELGLRGMPQAVSQEHSPASPLNRFCGNRIRGSGSMGPQPRLDYLKKN